MIVFDVLFAPFFKYRYKYRYSIFSAIFGKCKKVLNINYFLRCEIFLIAVHGIGAILVSNKGPVMEYTIGKLIYQGVRRTMLTRF